MTCCRLLMHNLPHSQTNKTSCASVESSWWTAKALPHTCKTARRSDSTDSPTPVRCADARDTSARFCSSRTPTKCLCPSEPLAVAAEHTAPTALLHRHGPDLAVASCGTGVGAHAGAQQQHAAPAVSVGSNSPLARSAASPHGTPCSAYTVMIMFSQTVKHQTDYLHSVEVPSLEE